jgi:hypothetical protein
VSKADKYKDKIREANKRNAREKLFGGSSPELAASKEENKEDGNANVDVNNNANIEVGWTSGGSDRTKMIGLYFEPEVAAALSRLNSQKGRGYKSYLVNQLVKDYLDREDIDY